MQAFEPHTLPEGSGGNAGLERLWNLFTVTLVVAGFEPCDFHDAAQLPPRAVHWPGARRAQGRQRRKGGDKMALVRFPPATLGVLLCKIKLLMYFHNLLCVGK